LSQFLVFKQYHTHVTAHTFHDELVVFEMEFQKSGGKLLILVRTAATG